MSNIEHVTELIDSEGYNSWDFDESGFESLERGIQLYHGRWSIVTLDVWADEEGHVFGIVHDVPATEYQEGMDSECTMVAVQPKMSWTTT